MHLRLETVMAMGYIDAIFSFFMKVVSVSCILHLYHVYTYSSVKRYAKLVSLATIIHTYFATLIFDIFPRAPTLCYIHTSLQTIIHIPVATYFATFIPTYIHSIQTALHKEDNFAATNLHTFHSKLSPEKDKSPATYILCYKQG